MLSFRRLLESLACVAATNCCTCDSILGINHCENRNAKRLEFSALIVIIIVVKCVQCVMQDGCGEQTNGGVVL